ncbi:MAG: secretin N-terminal domain-containing protein, partial [Planctomycetota bacterium]
MVSAILVAAAAATGQSSTETAATADGAATAESKPAPPIRFNFKGATFDQVIDFFSRSTGLPVVKETDVPEGTLDYLSPEAYELSEALRVLNIILQAKGVLLRVSGDMLYLQKLTEMQRENIPTYVGELPAELTPNEIVTVVRPLSIALAKPLAEKLAAMVAEYGSITAMEQQNSLVITETTAQARRLLRIVEELDRSDPEGAVEIFPIQHARATTLMEPLKALLSHKVEKYVINQKGQQVKIEEESLPGLNMSADDRTNAIIAKGVQSRLDRLREAIALLDVPAVGNGRQVRTFSLVRSAPAEVADKLQALYTKLPEAERPTILALDDLGKVTIVGPTDAMREAEALLREIDGGAVEPSEPTRTVAALPVEHGDPAAIADAVRNLLNGRQLPATRLLPGPDGRSLIVSGLVEDVHTIQSLLPVLDRPARVDRHVRLLR